MKLFTYTKWDALPVLAGLLHCAYVLTLFFIFPFAPWWLLIGMGFVYSISVSWNMNGISHNHIHNPYFYLENIESAVQHPLIRDARNLPNVLQIRASSASHGK